MSVAEASGIIAGASGVLADVLIVTINRAPDNMLDSLSIDALAEALGRPARESFWRVVVLQGAGAAFCGGIASAVTPAKAATLLDAIRACPVPVIAAVGGAAIGFGAVLAATCDMAFAAEGAYFSIPDLATGVMPGQAGLSRLLPSRVSRYLALTGESMAAADVARLGGVIQCVAADDLLEKALGLAAILREKSPTAIRLLKESINLTESLPLEVGQKVEVLYTAIASASPDGHEAALAFLEKRKPVWSVPAAPQS